MNFLRSRGERSKSGIPTWSLFRPLSTLNIGNGAILAIPTVGRCLEILAGDVARSPMCIHAKSAGAYYDRPDHPLLGVLADKPNDLITSESWRSKVVRDLMIRGEHLSILTRNGRGELLSITPAEAGTWGKNWDPQTQRLDYRAFGQTLLPSDVLHFRRGEKLWFQGESVLDQHRTTLAAIAEQYEAGKRVFSTALPKMKLETDEPLSADATHRLQSAYRETHGDATSWSTPIIVSGGMRVGEIAQRLDQNEWSAAMEFAVADVARMFGIPVTMVDSKSSPTAEDISSYLEAGLRPLLSLIAAELRLKLLARGERVHFKTDQLTRGTKAQQASSERQLIDAGIQTPNEARVSLGMAPLDQAGMNEIVISKNYQQMSEPGADDVGSDASGGDEDAN